MSAFWYMPQGDRSWASICSPSSSAASGSVGSAFGSAGRAFGSWAAAAGAAAPSAAGAAVAGAVALAPSAGAAGTAAWGAAGTACAVGSSAKEALGVSIRLISRAASRRGGREATLSWALRALGFMLAGPEGKEAVSSIGAGASAWTEGLALLQVILVYKSDSIAMMALTDDSPCPVVDLAIAVPARILRKFPERFRCPILLPS
ncbi:hypothetical protein FQZ97_429940 [compost metagenome]